MTILEPYVRLLLLALSTYKPAFLLQASAWLVSRQISHKVYDYRRIAASVAIRVARKVDAKGTRDLNQKLGVLGVPELTRCCLGSPTTLGAVADSW